MKVFFDNCTSPVLAETVDGFVRHQGHHAYHIRDIGGAGIDIPQDATDVQWIGALAADRSEWIVVTGDRRIATVRAEKQAFRMARLRGLLLDRAYQKTPVHQQASTLIWRWPDLVRTLEAFAPPTLIGVPISRGGKLQPLQW